MQKLNRTLLIRSKRIKVTLKKYTSFWYISENYGNKTKLSFIRLPQQKIDETWLTFWNFYVLTRYNHDNRYAMAAYQLSKKLKQQFNQNN